MSTPIPNVDTTMLLEEHTAGTNTSLVAQANEVAATDGTLAMNKNKKNKKEEAAAQRATIKQRNKATIAYWKFCFQVQSQTHNQAMSITKRYQTYIVPVIVEWDIVNHYYEEDLFEFYCKAVEVEQKRREVVAAK